MTAVSLDEVLAGELEQIVRRGLGRELRRVEGPQDASIVLDGVPVLNLSSNNYLGLANHAAVVAAGRKALAAEGLGAGSARLICGNLASHRALEGALAEFHGAEAALVFSSGYQANVGVLSALAGPEDAIFSDALNHASLIDGCRLSRATTRVYRHRDLEHLRTLLARTPARRRFIVTDSVFSMDGDLAPLTGLRELADHAGAFLMVDEAHATGVLGPGGRGLATETRVRADVHLATLGKALGTSGAYVSGSHRLITYLLHKARSFVFTTATPPCLAAAATAALAVTAGREGDSLREALRTNIRHFSAGLASRGLLAPSSGSTPIFPLHVGDEKRALHATAALLTRGIYAQAIRPPTVPPGTARLRMTLMATHTLADLDRALAAIDGLRQEDLLP
jgi:8-amino-7-oxononanoate synthase